MKAPIRERLEEYRKKNRISFAMPGHKGGAGIDRELQANFFAYDVTELEDTDSLHEPRAAMAEAQRRAADFFCAEQTLFLVNGSTSGIFIMLLACCKSGDRILVNRACHQSVIHACTVMGLSPVFIEQETIPEFGIPDGVNPELVEKKLQETEVSAVLVTSPSYYGIVSDVERIAEIVHRHGVPLLVDEAHGAHFSASKELFPESAICLGADLVVQSAHKTLNSMNQTAFLHVRSELLDTERLMRSSKMLQTSSPSYAMLATMDAARADLEENGADAWKKTVMACDGMRKELSGIVGILGETPVGKHIYALDRCRMVLHLSGYRMSGYQLSERLRTEYGIDVEMADLYNIVLIPTPANTEEEISYATRAIRDILKTEQKTEQKTDIRFPQIPEAVLTPQEAFYRKGAYLLPQEAVGRIVKNAVVIYPPGIALIAPGEKIGQTQIDFLMLTQKSGAEITGMKDGKMYVTEE